LRLARQVGPHVIRRESAKCRQPDRTRRRSRPSRDDANKQSSQADHKQSSETDPKRTPVFETLDEIEFTDVVSTNEGFLAYSQFLASEFSVSLLSFWADVNTFRDGAKSSIESGRFAEAFGAAHAVYTKYFAPNAPLAELVSYSSVSATLRPLVAPVRRVFEGSDVNVATALGPTLFDEMQHCVHDEMQHRLPRYLDWLHRRVQAVTKPQPTPTTTPAAAPSPSPIVMSASATTNRPSHNTGGGTDAG